MSLKLNERYPGRFNNPSADYPDGSFKNRTAPAAKDGSYLEQDWANDREGFFQSLLAAAGIEANGLVDKVGASQFFDAIQKLKQSQSGTAFTTTGPAAALVLTPAPAITAYAAGQRFRVKFNRASTGTDTVNISGLGPKLLKQYDSAGAKVAAVFAIDQLGDVEYDGTDAVLLDQLPAATSSKQGVRGTASNYKASANGISGNIPITCNRVTLEDSSGNCITVANVSITLNTLVSASATVSGMATGATVAGGVYGTYIWYNKTTGVLIATGDASLSAPTSPAPGFDFWARRGTFRCDQTGNRYPLSFVQAGNNVMYMPIAGSNTPAFPVIISGVQGSPNGTPITFVTGSVSTLVPSTAEKVDVSLLGYGPSVAVTAVASPSPATNAQFQSITNAPPLMINTNSSGGGTVVHGEFYLTSGQIYYAADRASCALYVTGWRDGL